GEDDVMAREPVLELGLELGAAVAELGELDEALEPQIAHLVDRPPPAQRPFLGVPRPFVTGRSNKVERTTWVWVRRTPGVSRIRSSVSSRCWVLIARTLTIGLWVRVSV